MPEICDAGGENSGLRAKKCRTGSGWTFKAGGLYSCGHGVKWDSHFSYPRVACNKESSSCTRNKQSKTQQTCLLKGTT